jgi:hypothetical protein
VCHECSKERARVQGLFRWEKDERTLVAVMEQASERWYWSVRRGRIDDGLVDDRHRYRQAHAQNYDAVPCESCHD